METFQSNRFADIGIPEYFVQDNLSGSSQGTLRGLHYQIKHTQGKLMSVVVGKIFDVAVDLRRSSSTFGKWVGTEISAEKKYQLWVPPGFAHGFYVLNEWAIVHYKVTDFYAPEWERTLAWNDPKVDVKWPLIDGRQPSLSEKDRNGLCFQETDKFE